MSKPNAEQVGEAVELIKDHHRQYGAAATEVRLSSLVYSIHSVLTGDGKPAAEHAEALENARQAKKPEKPAAPEVTENVGDASVVVEPAAVEATATVTPASEAAPEDEEVEGETYTEDELLGMTVAELKVLAEEGEVDLTGTTDKASIVAALMAAE